MRVNESEIIDYSTTDFNLSNISSTTASFLLSIPSSSISSIEVHSIENNNNNEKPNGTSEEFVPYENRPETYLVPLLFSIIFIVGVLGNGTLIIVFIKHRAMRNVPNT